MRVTTYLITPDERRDQVVDEVLEALTGLGGDGAGSK
jgi:hypothetical protein